MPNKNKKCPDCKGHGYKKVLKIPVQIDHHFFEPAFDYPICERCKGSGKIEIIS